MEELTLWECRAPQDTAYFWERLREYFLRDLYPGATGTPWREGYPQDMQALHEREENPLHYILFRKNGQNIGLAMTVIYLTEDQKQFILEFCVFPEFRGNGTGKACARALLDWGKANGARFAELNADGPRRTRFWASFGFIPNGRDRWGEPLMLLPPEEPVAFTVSPLKDTEELWDLESGFRAAVGEEPLDDGQQERLLAAIDAGEITFFVARRLNRPVGICSVSCCFSTFACRKTALFDDFFVEPAFRGQGIARKLARAAQAWCREQGCASLLVGCSPGDLPLYRALGFTDELGTMLAAMTE